ncbi:MAG: hypothetical protein ACTHMO_09000, partial [Rhodanobacteraceae bacterium]
MSTGRISSSSSMLELVRALSSSQGASAPKRAATGEIMAQEAGGRTRDLLALRQKLAAMAAALNVDDEQELAKARRPVLQEIVLWEFGADFRQHPEFAPMLDTIERAFNADPKAPERFAALI